MHVPLQVLIALWKDTREHHRFFSPADETEIANAETALGVRLPDPFRELYRFSDGLSLTNREPKICHLFADEPFGSLVATSRFREGEFHVPDDVLVFAVSDSGEPYGIWLGPHDKERFPEPIVEIAAASKPECMGFCAATLSSFLLGETVLGLILEEQRTALLKHLGPYGLTEDLLPEPAALDAYLGKTTGADGESLSLRAMESLGALRRWANPQVGSAHYNPYTARLDRQALKKLLN